jgi:hypothetical protein
MTGVGLLVMPGQLIPEGALTDERSAELIKKGVIEVIEKEERKKRRGRKHDKK